MQLIKEVLGAARDLQEKSPKDFVVGKNHQKDREAFILGSFAELYNDWPSKPVELAYCEPGDPEVSKENPDDFAVYGEDQSRICDVQIFQAFDPGRKIGEEWRDGIPQGLREVPNTEDPYEQLRQTLRKKLTRVYRFPSWLLIYVQNWSAAPREGYPGDLGEAALPVVESILREFNLPKIGIAEVWVQSPSGRKAFRVFPSVVRLPNFS